jgi:hypothetical protein
LNQINTAGRKSIGALAPREPEMPEFVASAARRFLLLRLISSTCARTKTLNKLRSIRTAIAKMARHPNADASTLTSLCKTAASRCTWWPQPNTPTPLQRRLRDRLKRLGENQISK